MDIKTGHYGEIYYWWNAEPGYPAGWFSNTGDDLDPVTLNPGDAVFMYCPSEGVTLNFPKVMGE